MSGPVYHRGAPDDALWEVGEVTGGDPGYPQTVYVTRYDARGASEPDGSLAPKGYVGLGVKFEGEHVYIHMVEGMADRVIALLVASLEDLRTLVPWPDLSEDERRALPPL